MCVCKALYGEAALSKFWSFTLSLLVFNPKFPLCNSVSGALGERMAFLFLFLFLKHLRASQNVSRTLRCSHVQGKQAQSGMVTIIWWASHRFQTPQPLQSQEASVWSSACRLPTSSPEPPTRSHPSVTLLTICSPANPPVLLRNAVKGSESSTGRTRRVTQYFMYTL